MDLKELKRVNAELGGLIADLEEKLTSEELGAILKEWEATAGEPSGKLDPQRLVEILRRHLRLRLWA